MTDTIQPTLDATSPAVTAAIQAETIARLQQQLADAQKIIDAATLGEGYEACIERECDHFITDEAWNRGEYCPEVKTRPVTAAELIEAREALAEAKAELAAREADWAAPSEAGNVRRQLLAGLSAELVDVDPADSLLTLVKAALDRIRESREELEESSRLARMVDNGRTQLQERVDLLQAELTDARCRIAELAADVLQANARLNLAGITGKGTEGSIVSE